MQRVKIIISGVVQGVGLRPYLHRLVTEHNLTGWIRNRSDGVELELEGASEAITAVVARLHHRPPRLAQIEAIQVTPCPSLKQEKGFSIRPSKKQGENHTFVCPDAGICEDCLRELRNPADRRYRYPFLNCTNCGPRFTILRDVPYDRARTSMVPFPMCDQCRKEYQDVKNRRYHAQPNCCPDCGPQVYYRDGQGQPVPGDAIALAQACLREGGIVAVKGLGGFHFACRADEEEPLRKLRRRKHRDEKPLAVMCADVTAAGKWCQMSPEEEALLTSWRRPIVLLRKKADGETSSVLRQLSENRELGVMLPYTPLHYLLMEGFDALVMTSANRSDCPVVCDNETALRELGDVADGFLLHNREIVTRCDDSLVRVFAGKPYFLRRSRGYAPQPLALSIDASGILACGAEQKASFALSKGQNCFLSQHIGDLKNAETLTHYEQQITHFEQLFGIRTETLVCDLHPNYLSTVYAQARSQREGLPLVQVQHHHAHMAACMADNGLEEPCIGVIWDGTGYGNDGTIWGGEWLAGDAGSFRRLGSIRPIPLLGGDKAVREIERIGFALLNEAGCPEYAVLSGKGREKAQWFRQMLANDLNTPRTSSVGRLFDGISSILTGRVSVTYEGQGAMLLETMAEPCEETYPTPLEERDGLLRFDYRPMVRQLAAERASGYPPEQLASKFMNTLATLAQLQCCAIREQTGLNHVVLSGGVFQNQYLLPRVIATLEKTGFTVYHHCHVSTNDQGIALGQTVIAAKGGGRYVSGHSIAVS